MSAPPLHGPASSRSAFRRALLVPLSVTLALLLAIFVAAELLRERQALETERVRSMNAVLEAFDIAIRRDTDKLGAALKAIAHNTYNRGLFINRQREALFAGTRELFEELRREHGITHFYFITPDREMFLRVQRPDSHGDRIDRTTLLQAERTGQPAAGLELGQKGVFTLRVVQPWVDAVGQRIGYIELGKEIDRTLAELQEITGVDVFLLVDKRYLNRQQWEEGMDMIQRAARNWDLLPDMVVAGRTGLASDELLLAHPAFSGARQSLHERHRAHVGGRHVEFGALPLTDASGSTLGTIVVVNDLTAMDARQTLFFAIIMIAAMIFAAVMLAVAHRAINRAYDAGGTVQ